MNDFIILDSSATMSDGSCMMSNLSTESEVESELESPAPKSSRYRWTKDEDDVIKKKFKNFIYLGGAYPNKSGVNKFLDENNFVTKSLDKEEQISKLRIKLNNLKKVFIKAFSSSTELAK